MYVEKLIDPSAHDPNNFVYLIVGMPSGGLPCPSAPEIIDHVHDAGSHFRLLS